MEPRRVCYTREISVCLRAATMSRRTLRSARAHVCLEPVLVLPDSLRGTILPLKNPTKRVKKEHEDGMFAVVRRERSAEPIDVSLLRVAVNEYLYPDMDGLGRPALCIAHATTIQLHKR